MPDPEDKTEATPETPPVPPADPSPEDEIGNIEEEGDVLGGNFA